MRYRRLGRTGLEVSEISLGTVELGMAYGIPEDGRLNRPDEGTAARLLHRALDLGINFLDTARLYGDAEAIIGRAIGGRRGEYHIVSKVPNFAADGFRGEELRRRVFESIEESLRQLRTEVLDVVMLHSAPLEVIRSGELVEILDEARDRGLVRWLGISLYGEEAALLAIADGRYDCMQIAYSILDRRPESRVLPSARQSDIGIVVRSVLLKGALTHRYRYLPDSLEKLKSAVSRLLDVAGGTEAGLVALAYRYVLSFEPPDSVLAGPSEISELEQIVAAAELGPLEPELLARLSGIAVQEENLLHPGLWPEMAPINKS